MKTFDDIQFKERKGWGQWSGTLQIGNFVLSVVAGERLFSLPRTFQSSIDEFSKFEVAVLNSEREFVTDFFVGEIEDDVLGWQSREQINELITRMENHENI